MAFKGKIEFITGGLGGIGYATVNYFLQNNISVCLCIIEIITTIVLKYCSFRVSPF